MAYVPDLAISDRQEVTTGEFLLYVAYCKFASMKNDRVTAGLQTVAGLIGMNYAHASSARAALIRKGWIRKAGRETILLKGRDEKFGKSQTFIDEKVSEIPNFADEKSLENTKLLAPESLGKSEVLPESEESLENTKLSTSPPESKSLGNSKLKVSENPKSHNKDLTSLINQPIKTNIRAVDLAIEVFEITPPLHTQQIISEQVTGDFDLWKQALVDAKAGMSEQQLKNTAYTNRSYTWTLKNFRAAVERRANTKNYGTSKTDRPAQQRNTQHTSEETAATLRKVGAEPRRIP